MIVFRPYSESGPMADCQLSNVTLSLTVVEPDVMLSSTHISVGKLVVEDPGG